MRPPVMKSITYPEAKEQFIHTWGHLTSLWGVSKTMGQIQALMLTSADPMCMKEIMKELDISKGAVHQNLTLLLEWGLAHKVDMPDAKCDYFIAEKDLWTILRAVIAHRKERELLPMIQELTELHTFEGDGPDAQNLRDLIAKLLLFGTKVNHTLDYLAQLQSNSMIQRILQTTHLDPQ